MGVGDGIWLAYLANHSARFGPESPLPIYCSPSLQCVGGPVIWLIIGISLIAMPCRILSGTNLGVISMSRFLAVDIPLSLFGGLVSRYEGLRWLPCIAAILALVLFVSAALYAMGGCFIG
jgi:hypothetical protein